MSFRGVRQSAWLALCLPFLFSLPALAQGVYVTRGENGPVFSDKPQSGAKEVTLRPLSVVPAVREPQKKSEARPAEKAGAESSDNRREREKTEALPADYRSFSIVSPEPEGSVVANTAQFEVRLAVDPPLLLEAGHAFVVSINGARVDQRFTATEFMIPPEFWSDSWPAPNQPLLLAVSIVDGDGLVLKKATPVRFYWREARVFPPHRRYPHLPVSPQTPVKPPPEKASKRGNVKVEKNVEKGVEK